MPNPLDTADLRRRVQDCLDHELTHQAQVVAELGPDVDDLLRAVTDLLRGGKRLRAAFLYWGHRAAGRPDSQALVRLASAMELFQAAALIHDDVMDDSDTRRGMPAAHRAMASAHAERGLERRPRPLRPRRSRPRRQPLPHLGRRGLRDVRPAADDVARGRPFFDRMRSQLMAGQFLDVVESMRPWSGVEAGERVERAGRVITYKSAKYTVEHPLLIGAATGGLDEAGTAALSRYGLDLGRAFQLRDDLLGVFGDPEATGKPAGDDLREGKRTVLLAHALAGTDDAGRGRLEQLVGRADLDGAAVDELRGVITASGAVDVLEARIADLAGSARDALAAAPSVDAEARTVLDGLVDVATARSA